MTDTFTNLDFHHGLPSHSFVDKKSGVRVNLGHAGSFPQELQHYIARYGGILLGLQEAGIDGGQLDRVCATLESNARALGLDILIGKSDRPFDRQWYFFGDIVGLLEAAWDERLQPPFGTILHDRISKAMSIITRR